MMKKIFVLLGIFCLTTSLVQAQIRLGTTPGALPPGDVATVDQGLGQGNYQVYNLNADDLIELAAAQTAQLDFSLNVGATTYEIEVSRRELLGPNFKVELFQQGKVDDLTQAIDLASYRGNLKNDPSAAVSMSITSLGIAMTIDQGGKRTNLVPSFVQLHHRPVSNEYLWYESRGGGVGENNPPWPTNSISCYEIGSNVDFNRTVMLGPCQKIIEVMADADVSFMGGFNNDLSGTISAVVSIFLAVESGEQIWTNELNIGLQVNRIRLFRDQPDSPYPSGLNLQVPFDRNQLLDAVINTFTSVPQSSIQRDLAVLFTGESCVTLEGLARASSMCKPEAAILMTDCSFSGGNVGITMAHEIGHTLAADDLHSTGDFCTGVCGATVPGVNSLMCAGDCELPNPLFLDAVFREIVDEYLEDNSACLQTNATISGPAELCAGQTATYTFTPTGNTTITTPITWSVAPGLTINSQTNTSVSVTANNSYNGRTWVQVDINDNAFLDACNPSFRRHLIVGTMPALCNSTNYTLCMGSFLDLPIGTRPGWSISNLQCVSPSNNCGTLNWTTFGNSSSLILFVLGGTPGEYMFSYDITSGCGNTTTYYFFVDIKTFSQCDNGKQAAPVARSLEAVDLSIAPNPNSGNFQLRYTLPLEARPEITVRNGLGQLVYELPTAGWQASGEYAHELNLAHLPNGLYLVNVRTGSGQKTVRMTINH